MDFTNMTFSGRLTADPKSFKSKAGKEMCKFTVATSRRVGPGEEKTSYLEVLVTGPEAHNCAEYLSKGREVLVNATFETDTYTDSNDIKRKGFTFIVNKTGYVKFGSGGRKSADKGASRSTSSNMSDAMSKASAKLSRDSGI